MIAFLKDLFGFLLVVLPKRETAETDEHFKWRQMMSFALLGNLSLSVMMAAVSTGQLASVGVDGYVNVAQLGGLERMVRETREDQLVQQILDNTRRYCLAYEAGDTQGMTFAFQALQDVRIKYFQLTKREYPQLMCSMSAQPAKPQ